MKFKAIIASHGKTATGIVVPEEIVEGLGAGRKPAVKVTIKGHTYRSSVSFMGGKFMLGISAENRKITEVNAGDEIEVELVLDTDPREVVVPADLVEALDSNSDAKRFFDGLSYSNKLRHILLIEQAKTPATREKRIDKAINMLQAGQK